MHFIGVLVGLFKNIFVCCPLLNNKNLSIDSEVADVLSYELFRLEVELGCQCLPGFTTRYGSASICCPTVKHSEPLQVCHIINCLIRKLPKREYVKSFDKCVCTESWGHGRGGMCEHVQEKRLVCVGMPLF